MITKKAYVVGDNVSESMSPHIFKYWFKQHKISSTEYGFIEIKKENFENQISNILKKEELVGINVTIPFKEEIYLYINKENKEANPKIKPIEKKPINCLTFRKKEHTEYESLGRIKATNTDGRGFLEALYRKTSFKTNNNCVIVLGFGGASKAIITSLCKDPNFERIIIFNRTFDKTANLKSTFKNNKIEAHELKDLYNFTKNAQLIINTTPTNILNDNKKYKINNECVGFDVVYKPWDGTGFLKNFRAEKRIQGIHMLVGQAAPCFKEWFGVDPDTNDPELYKDLFLKMGGK